jgi:hypothetical protein
MAKHNHDSLINNIPLISYVLMAANKWLLISESRGDSNQCTSYRGKPDQYATCIPRSVRVWSQTIRISRSQCITTFHQPSIELDRVTTPEKKRIPDYSPSTSAEKSVGSHLVSLLLSTTKLVEKAKHLSTASY